MKYDIDDKIFYIFELMYDNDYGTYWHIEENKDTFKEINEFTKLRKSAFNVINSGNEKFNNIDLLNMNKKVTYARKSAAEYIYGSNSKKLNKDLLYLKFRISPSIDDLMNNAMIKYSAPLIHKNKLFPKGFNNYQGILCIDNKMFRYLIRIGITKKDNSLFYDVSLYYLGNLKNKKGTNITVPGVKHVTDKKIC
jgi:hypothetical protein